MTGIVGYEKEISCKSVEFFNEHNEMYLICHEVNGVATTNSMINLILYKKVDINESV